MKLVLVGLAIVGVIVVGVIMVGFIQIVKAMSKIHGINGDQL